MTNNALYCKASKTPSIKRHSWPQHTCEIKTKPNPNHRVTTWMKNKIKTRLGVDRAKPWNWMRINLGLGLKPQLQSLSSGLLILDLGLGFGTELGPDNFRKDLVSLSNKWLICCHCQLQFFPVLPCSPLWNVLDRVTGVACGERDVDNEWGNSNKYNNCHT